MEVQPRGGSPPFNGPGLLGRATEKVPFLGVFCNWVTGNMIPVSPLIGNQLANIVEDSKTAREVWRKYALPHPFACSSSGEQVAGPGPATNFLRLQLVKDHQSPDVREILTRQTFLMDQLAVSLFHSRLVMEDRG